MGTKTDEGFVKVTGVVTEKMQKSVDRFHYNERHEAPVWNVQDDLFDSEKISWY